MGDEFLGLKDNGKEVISCFSCGENLCVIWDVDPSATETMFVIAKCPFCENGKSKKYVVKKKNKLGIPDSGKISHIDFEDSDGNTQMLLPAAKVHSSISLKDKIKKDNPKTYGNKERSEDSRVDGDGEVYGYEE